MTTFVHTLKQATMEGFSLYIQYFIKLFLSIKLFATPSGMVSGISVTTVLLLSSVQQSILLLLGLFMLDFATGIAASIKEQVDYRKKNPDFPKNNFVSSEKLKLSLVKLFTYTTVILSVNGIETIFKIKTFSFPSITTHNYSITLIVIGVCTTIEFYSIFFENFKRMGFDIISGITKTVKAAKKVYDEVKK